MNTLHTLHTLHTHYTHYTHTTHTTHTNTHYTHKHTQVYPELVVMDSGSINAFLNQYAGQFLPIAGLIFLRGLVGTGEWVLKKLGRVRKSTMQQAAEQFTRFRVRVGVCFCVCVLVFVCLCLCVCVTPPLPTSPPTHHTHPPPHHTPNTQGKEFNVEEKGKEKSVTGVSYKDVAGIDHVLDEIKEVMAMLLGDDAYERAGARAPRVR